MDLQKLEYHAAGKRRADTLGITAVVLAAVPLLVICLVLLEMVMRPIGKPIPSIAGDVLLIAFGIGLICGFVGLVLGVVAVISRSRSARKGLLAIGLVVLAFAILQWGK